MINDIPKKSFTSTFTGDYLYILYWGFLISFPCLPLVQNENLGSTSTCFSLLTMSWGGVSTGCWLCIPLYLKESLGITYACILVFFISRFFFGSPGLCCLELVQLKFWRKSPWSPILKLEDLLCDISGPLDLLIFVVTFINLPVIIELNRPSIRNNIGLRCWSTEFSSETPTWRIPWYKVNHPNYIHSYYIT